MRAMSMFEPISKNYQFLALKLIFNKNGLWFWAGHFLYKMSSWHYSNDAKDVGSLDRCGLTLNRG